jgi:hypothetical protein
VNGLEEVRDGLKYASNGQPTKIGIPYGIGSDLAGGSWRVVKAIIQSVFEDEPNITCVICRLPNMRELK